MDRSRAFRGLDPTLQSFVPNERAPRHRAAFDQIREFVVADWADVLLLLSEVMPVHGVKVEQGGKRKL